MRGGKGTAVSALTGAVTAFAIGKLAENVAWVRENWYAPPLVLIGAGHFLKRKQLNLGTSVIAAGGAVGYYGYALTHGGAQGEDADAMPVDPGDAGAAMEGNAGAFDAYENVNANRAFMGTQGYTTGEASAYEATEAYGLQG